MSRHSFRSYKNDSFCYNLLRKSVSSDMKVGCDDTQDGATGTKPFYECQFCDFTSSFKSCTKRHFIKMHKVFPCKLCNFFSDTRENLNSHQSSDHGITTNSEGRRKLKDMQIQNPIASSSVEQSEDVGLLNYERQEDGTYKCTLCDFKSKVHQSVTRHKQGEHDGIRYKCTECDYVTKQQGSIDIHKKAVHEGITFSCHVCNFQSGYKHVLNSHLKIHKDNFKKRSLKLQRSRVECDECQKSFQTESGLKIHKEVKHDGVVYSCKSCNYKTQHKQTLKRHSKTYHGEESHIGKELRLPCPDCSFTTLSKQSLKIHITAQHDGITFNCDECDYTTKYKSNINIHKKGKHSNVEAKRFQCSECPFTTTYYQSFRYHMKNGHRERICKDCNFLTNKKQILRQHRVEFHGVKSFIKCENCKFVCRTQERMKKHQTKWMSCKNCDYKTCSKAEFLIHKRNIHNSTREKILSLECYRCDFKAKSKGGILTHKSRCKANKYRCTSFCRRTFPDLIQLKTHKETVKHERVLFKCTECQKQYKDKRSLEKHNQVVHLENVEFMLGS